MNRLQWLAAVLLGLELAGGAYWWHEKRTVRPRTPAWGSIEPLAADQIRLLHEACRSAADWRRLGECCMAHGFYLEAEACHRQAVTLAPGDAEFAYQWAFALERLGLLDEANGQYEKAIQLGHSHPHECWYLIGRNHLRAEQLSWAEAAFAKAGNLGAARYERARLAARKGRTDEAMALADALADEFPTTAQPHLLLHRIDRLTGRLPPDERLTDRAAMAKVPLPNPFDRPYARLMKTLKEFGTVALVKRIERETLGPEQQQLLRDAQQRFWTPSAADLLAEAHLQQRQFDDARRVLQEVLEVNGPSAHFLIRLGDVHEEMGEFSQAVALWSRALPLDSTAELKDLHAKLHQVHAKAGRHGLAQHHLAQAYFGAGVEAFWKNDLVKAHGALRLAVENEPKHADAWLYQGDACRLLRQEKEARQAYERALALRPESGRAQRGLRLLK